MLNFLIKPIFGQDWAGVGGPEGDVATIYGFEDLFRNLLGVITTLAGIALAVMLVVGGFKLIFAGGDKQKIQSARQTFTTAIIGLALMVVAWFVLLLIQEFTGIQVTRFEIPRP